MTERETQKRSFLHDVILHNLGIKVLSLVGAALVWLIIVNIDDPLKTKTFHVRVETINESAIASVNKVFEITSGSVADVRVRGKRSVIDKLDETDIRAIANLADLSSVNAVAIQPSLRRKVASEVTLECSDVLKVALENMATKQLKVTIVTEGEPSDGYTIGNCTAKPNMIRVSGGESTIDQIETVKVFLNVDGVSGDFSSRLEPRAYDDKDKEVKSSTLTFSDSKVRVRAKVLETKTIPVRVEVSGTPADGYEYVETECLPKELEIAGTTKKLEEISELLIPIDINGMTDNSSQLEKTINVSEYLGEGITVSEENETVSIKITIEKMEKRLVQIAISDIQFHNLGKNLIAEAEEENKSVSVLVSGRSSLLAALPDTALVAYVDCEGKQPGRYSLSVKLDLGKECRITNKPKIRVKISRGQKESIASPTPENTLPPVSTEPPEKTTKPETTVTPEPDTDEEDS